MADQQDLVPLARETPRFVVHLRDEWARGVDRRESSRRRFVVYLGGDTVRRNAGPWTPAVHLLLRHLVARTRGRS
jgi:hypothetical protein